VLLGAVRLAGSDGLLAAFVASVTMKPHLQKALEEEQEQLQTVVKRFFTIPVFVLLGTLLPWDAWLALGWRAIAFPVALLLLRRPILLLALRPLVQPLRDWKDALFIGWFGPIGVAALYYATLAVQKMGDERPFVLGSLAITASLLAHGITSVPLTRAYGRRAVRDTEPEAKLDA
jgi:NhaP-type Na+/H+ or K+/H+ antiporter